MEPSQGVIEIKLLHFNDVYNIQEQKEKGEVCPSAARFVTAMKRNGCEKKIVSFGGDLFNPSLMSYLYKGDQMIDVFNQLNVKVSCLGNHDLDFGIARMEELVSKTP